MLLRKVILKICSKYTGHRSRNVCDFNKVAKQHLAWVFSYKFAIYFQNSFSQEHLWRVASVHWIYYSQMISVRQDPKNISDKWKLQTATSSLTLSWPRSLSYRNQFTDMDWFLYDRRVETLFLSIWVFFHDHLRITRLQWKGRPKVSAGFEPGTLAQVPKSLRAHKSYGEDTFHITN